MFDVERSGAKEYEKRVVESVWHVALHDRGKMLLRSAALTILLTIGVGDGWRLAQVLSQY